MSPAAADVVCRVCLAADVRMLPIEGALEPVYEKLAGSVLHADRTPTVACYICHKLLHTARKLMLKAVTAEKVLRTILKEQSEITVGSVSSLDRHAAGLSVSLSVSDPEVLDNMIPQTVVQVKVEEGLCNYDEEQVASNGPMDGAYTENTENQPSNHQEDDTTHAHAVTRPRHQGQLHQAEADEASVNTFADAQAIDTADVCQESVIENVESASKNSDRTINTAEKPHQCHICQQNFRFKNNLARHLRSHKGENPFKCYQCVQRFKSEADFTEHTKSHNTEKPFQCNICERRLKTKLFLHKHMKLHEENNIDSTFECDYCQRQFNHKSRLIHHLITHTNEKPNKCSLCQRGFKHLHALKLHMLTHTNEKPNKCRLCQRAFKQPNALKQHMLTHTNETVRLRCDICQKSFGSKIALKYHIESHNNKCKCLICERTLSSRASLKKHLQIHERPPNVCEVCEKICSSKANLLTHMKTHERKVPATKKLKF